MAAILAVVKRREELVEVPNEDERFLIFSLEGSREEEKRGQKRGQKRHRDD